MVQGHWGSPARTTNFCARGLPTSPTYRLPRESAAIAWTARSSPGFCWPRALCGTLHRASTRPVVSNFIRIWSLGGMPTMRSAFRHCMGDEPQTQISSCSVIHSPQGTIRFRHWSNSLPLWSKTWTRTLLRSAT